MATLKRYNSSSGLWESIGGVGIATGNAAVFFRARQNADQSLSGNVDNQLQYPLEDFDSANCYNTSTSRFTPNVAGYYWIHVQVRLNSGSGGLSEYIRICKNGVSCATTNYQTGNSNDSWPSTSTIVYCNGTTDYITAVIYPNGSFTTDGTSDPINNSVFEGFLITNAYTVNHGIVDLTNASSDYYLGVGETAKITYTSATSIPLHIQTAIDAEYEIHISASTLATAAASTNNITFVGSSGAYEVDIIYPSSTTAVSNYQSTGTSANFAMHIADGVIRKAKISITCKSGFVAYLCHSHANANNGYTANRMTTIGWASTISSLGTLTYSTAQSGTVIIKRIA